MSAASPPAVDAGELLDDAPAGFVSFTDGGEIVAVNRTLARLLGYPREELQGRSIDTLLTTPTRIFYQTHFFPLLTLHGRADELFLTLKASDGSPVHVLANAVRVEREGVVLNSCVFMRIQERHKYEEALVRARRAAEEANVARMRFLSMMSHDLRTPLNAISGYADLMLMGIRGEVTEEQRRDLTRMKDASGYLLDMLNDVLAFVKLEAGQLEMDVRDVPLARVVRRAEELVLPRVLASSLTLSGAECAGDLVVRADESRLQQVLLNLLTNAIKFTPSGGTVRLSCEARGNQVLLSVADTGPGIPDDQQTWIFEPFTQLEGRTQASKEGVGLGLAISRQFARAMGGDVTVGNAPGGGAVFTVALRGGFGPEPGQEP